MALTRSAFLACALLAFCGTAEAAIVTGSSSADFIDVGIELDLLPGVGGGATVDAQIHNVAPASGNAPPAYSSNNPVVDVDISAGAATVPVLGTPIVTVANVTAGTVESTVSSDVDGLAGARFANGTHEIVDLDLSIADLPVLPDLISITADSIDVSSVVSGDFGALGAVGTLEVANLVISISGVTAATLNGTIAPNTGIDLSSFLGGVSLMLNQQTLVGDGLNSLALTTNAISLELTDVGLSGIGDLNGSVVVGPTFASLGASAVPEPSSAIMLGLVCAGAVWVRRRSNRKAALALEA